MGLKNFLKTWITKSDTIVSLPKLPDNLPDYQQPELTRTNNAEQLRIALAGGFQGGPITNHFEEAKHVEGFSYIAIHAISMQLHRATVSAYWDGEDQDKNQSQRKSLQSVYGTRWKAAYGAEELEKITLERNHALMQLLAKPNPIEPGGMFRYRQSMQIRTTGGSFIWNCPNVFGRTCQRYVVPTTAITPIWPCANLPKGGYRIQPNCMRWIPLNDEGYVRGMPALTRVLGMVIPAEYMQKVGFPHPMWLDDFYSPMSAGSQWVDAERAINIARTAGVSNSMTPNIHVELPETSENIDQDVLTITKRMWDKGYGGPDNFGRSMVTPFGTKVTQLSGGKTDMGYHDGYTDTKESVLALHGTPPVAIGIQEAGALAAYNASLIQFGHTTVQPLCDVIAESDTHVIAPQFGDGITVEIEHQKVNDEAATNAKVEIAVRAGSIKKDTVCALLGIEALGGTEGQKLAAPVQQPKDKESGTQRSEDADDRMPAPPIAPSVDNPMGRTEMNTPTSKTMLAALDGMKEADDELLTERIDRIVESRLKAMKARDADKPYKFSSIQINIPESMAKKVMDVGKLIPGSELADDGRENDIHVTCLFGIHSSDPADVSMAITSFGQFEIELGKTSYFECDGYDVVKIDVISQKLVELHDRLCDSTPFTSTHPVYVPHCTIAYVASGCGKKYAGISVFEGDKFTAENVVFTSTDKKKTTIKLEPPQRKSLGMSGEIGSDGGFAVKPELNVELRDHENGSDPSYGNCPFCGKPGMERERRVDGNTKCEDGHVYPSSASVFDRQIPQSKSSGSDVSDEQRASNGKWTSGSGTPSAKKPAIHTSVSLHELSKFGDLSEEVPALDPSSDHSPILIAKNPNGSPDLLDGYHRIGGYIRWAKENDKPLSEIDVPAIHVRDDELAGKIANNEDKESQSEAIREAMKQSSKVPN